jgi:hypothetical protein
VEARHAVEPSQHLRHVGAEDAAVGVELVEHDEVKALEEAPPRRVVGQDAGVQHVGRADQHARRVVAQLAACGVRRIAVVDRDAQVEATEGCRVLLEAPALVLGERLEGEEIEGARFGIFAGAPQHGQVVDEGLAAGGGRCEHQVAPALEQLDGPRLVAVELLDAPPRQQRRQRLETARQPRCEHRRPGGQHFVVLQRLGEGRIGSRGRHERSDVGHWIPRLRRRAGRPEPSTPHGEVRSGDGVGGGTPDYPARG